jgi:hypothetical protein
MSTLQQQKLSAMVILAGLLSLQALPPARVATAATGAPLVKATFLYNFAKFIDWPAEPLTNIPFTLCQVGSDAFAGALPSLQGKPLKDTTLVVKYFTRIADADLQACHLLFISASEQERLPHLLVRLKQQPVLTVSEMEGFTRSGGMINFVAEQHALRFVINAGAVQRAGLHIRSQLLKLALRVEGE